MERSGGDMRRDGFSGLQRRRAGFRDSREEDGSRQMELQEMVRVKDREMFQKKDRDREFSKRRRVERQTTRNESHRELESSDSSDEDSDEEEEEDYQQKMKIHQQNRMNPPPPAPTSARSNHRRSLRTLRSTPVTRTAVDELIGVPIPRRARSGSFKRVHEHWSSGNGGLGEELNRRKFSASPATGSPIGGGGSSPSSSGGSSMKKKRKSVEPRNRTLNSGASNSKVTVPDDIEFEVAEALFDLMKQSQSSKNVDDDDGEGKRLKKADDVRQDKNGGFSAQIDQSIEESKKEEHGEKEKEMVDEQVEDEKSVSAKESESPSSSCVKVNACIIQDPTVTKTNDETVSDENKKDGGKGKLDIDLMAPPISASSRGKDLVVDTTSNPMAMVMSHEAEKEPGTVQKGVSPASVLPLVETNGTTSGSKLLSLDLENNASGASTSNGNKELQTNILQNPFAPFTTIPMNVWPGVLPHPGYMASLQAVLPVDGSTRPSAAVMQTPQFQFSQPRRKRCATHQYLAVNIQSHQQLVNKSLTSGFSGSTTNLCGMKQLNLHSKSQPENLFSGDGGPKVTAMSGVDGKGKSSDVAKSLNTPMSNTLASQQASAQKFLQGPAFILPFGQHQATAVASSGNASGQHLSAAVVGDASMPSNGALNLCLPAMSLNHQNMLTNEAISPYMAMLQKNGCQFPIPPNSTLQKNGSQVPVVPFFNSSFCSSQVFNISPNLQHLSLPHALVQSSPQNTSTSSGSSSRKPPLGQKRTGANVSDGKSNADVGRNPLTPSNSQMFSNLILPVNGGLPKTGEPQQKGSSGRNFTQQALAMLFGSNSSMNSALNFQMLPDMSQNAYLKSFQASDGKSAVASANPQGEPKSMFGRMETGSQSLNFNKSGPSDVSATMGASLFDGLARNINMVPSTLTGKQALSSSGTSVAIPNFTNFHQHQHQLQKHHMQQIQLSGPPKHGNPGPFLSSNFPSSNTISGRAENSSFPPQWDNMPGTAADGSSQSAAMSFPQQLKGSQGQTHISFGNMPASSSAFQGQHIGSSSNSSIPKNVAGGLRIPSAPPQQQVDVSQQQNGSSQKSSSPACRRNVPSILSTCPSQPSELKY